MKKTLSILLLTSTLTSSLFATDFSSMTTEELINLRGTVDSTEKDLYKSEMQSRMSSLSTEERQELRGGYSSSSNGKGTMQRLRDGSASGGQYKGSRRGGGKH